MMKPPKQVHPLSDSELSEIQRVIGKHPKPRVRVRAIMLRMSHEGLSAPEIATLLGVSRQTVLHQLQRYEASGIIGIEDRPRPGAPAKANAEYIAKLKQAVGSDPRELGYRFSVWSVERLQKHLVGQTRVELSSTYLHQLMQKHDIVYRKPKHDLEHKQDPEEVSEKKRLLEFLKKRGRLPISV